MRYNEVRLIFDNDEERTVSISEAARMIENFQDCLRSDGRYKRSGIKYIWVYDSPKSAKPYRMRAFGGYECGGVGCFYEYANSEVLRNLERMEELGRTKR